MKNNTKVRLHLSKKLFESLTKEIIKEAKANDGYTVAVKQPKQPKQSKSQATSPEVQKTDKEKTMGEVHAQADTKKMEKMKEMEMNVAEEGQLDEFTGTETESSGAIAMLAAALGMGVPLAAALIKDLMKKKTPEEKKQAVDAALTKKSATGTTNLKEYEHHYEVRNGECRRYNDEGEYEVVSMHHCR